MEHRFLLLTSGSREVALNVAASTRAHLDHFTGTMLKKGWTLTRIGAKEYRRFKEDRQKMRVLEDIQATYKIRESSLAET
jgi:hypothetical protein